MILYKYRQDNDYTAKIFTSKEVWLSTPANLNDPFEAAFRMPDEKFKREKVSYMRQGQLAGFILASVRGMSNGKFFGLSKADNIALVRRFKKFETEDEAYSAFSSFMKEKTGNAPSDPEELFSVLQKQIASVGIFSLSELFDNSLMWAHYAGDHTGICIGFEVTDGSILSDKDRFLEVKYSDNVPELEDEFMTQLTISIDSRGRHLKTAHQIAFNDPTLQTTVSTKGKEWAYEREWRYVEPSAGAFAWPGPIVEMTFGLNCPKDRRDHYIKLAQENVPNDVRIYEIKTRPGTREFERVRIPSPIEEFSGEPTDESIEVVKVLLENRRYLKALSILQKLLQRMPERAELWRQKGIALGWCEDHAAALQCFEKATSLMPNHSSAWYQKGVALTEVGQLEEAIEAFKSARNLGLNDPSISFNLGGVLAALGEYKSAINELQLAKKCGHPRAENRIKLIESILNENPVNTAGLQ
jgi:tetratricopeptide (TPR) repeat protein